MHVWGRAPRPSSRAQLGFTSNLSTSTMMRPSDDHRVRDTASRKRQATGRFPLKAGINFHSSVARSSSASAHFVFPDGSAERTFPAESITRSSSNSDSGKDCAGPLNGGRRSCIGRGEIISDLPGPDLLAASKSATRFFFPLEPPADRPSTSARIPRARASRTAVRIRSTSAAGHISASERHASCSRPL